jgi:endonuclease/exonuclease/phosphatase family metal-dependent hydrolase
VKITTWNVLHRIHAENWKEAPVTSHPDERDRSAAVAALVARWLDADTDIVCLQEVSGDQLAALRGVVGPNVRVFDHVYPRIPRLRREGGPDLHDPKEHLVVLVKDLAARQHASSTFASDPGKGMLVVDVGDDARIIDTHVTFGPRGIAQLEVLAGAARDERRASVVVGDFNAPRDVVQAGLGGDIVVAEVVGPTRIASAESSGKTIDHVAVRGASIVSVHVLDANGLSDHQPVIAEITLVSSPRPGGS